MGFDHTLSYGGRPFAFQTRQVSDRVIFRVVQTFTLAELYIFISWHFFSEAGSTYSGDRTTKKKRRRMMSDGYV